MQIVKTVNVTVRTILGSINTRFFVFVSMCGSGGGVFINDAEGLAYPPRGSKLEFKMERYPPLDGASCVRLSSIHSVCRMTAFVLDY